MSIRSLPMPSLAPLHRLTLACGIALLLAGGAQHAGAEPIAENDAADLSAAQPAEQTAARRARPVGAATSSLLAAQADGSIAGPGLPMLGTTGNLSWHRYLDSYKYKIPETFGNKIDSKNNR